jgi:biopolymer transport protein ExbB/TolQ
MTSPQSRQRLSPDPADRSAARERRGNGLLPALLGGVPLAVGVLCSIHFTSVAQTEAARYVHNPVEWVEVLMFCCAASALAAKLWQHARERLAGRYELLPPWDGNPAPLAEAARLLAGLNRLPARLHRTRLVRRVAAVLDFLCRRGSAAELDDQLRALADGDSVALENSYSLIRFITWAIPILGFLGTVLGITMAISGVTPEKLETGLNQVTDGLAIAFDATALALGLTMLTMFLSFVVDRLEQGALEDVDRYVDCHLAHRFARPGGAGDGTLEAVRQNTQVLLQASEELVRRQAELWASTIEEADYRRTEEEKRHQERLAGALEKALERTLKAHAEQVAALQRQAVEDSARLLERLATLAETVRATGQEQQAGLRQVAEAVVAQANVLGQLQAGEKHLLRLEQELHQNLTALAGAQAFEQALHSLTAAVHLLTSRVPGEPRPSRLGTRPGPGAAA